MSMKNIFWFSFILFFTTAFGQDDKQLQHQIGISPFVLEMNTETINQELEPKLLTSLYYLNQLNKRWSWNSQIEYGENSLNDNCRSCADHIYGKGQYSELSVFSGLKFTLNANKEWRLKYNLGLDIYASRLNYSGYFEGGWSGGFYFRNNTYWVVGGQLGLGLNYAISKRIIISSNTSLRIGYGFQKNLYTPETLYYSSGALTATKLSIGYLF
jgi:hypothetical protein